jgi:hypothetical protein
MKCIRLSPAVILVAALATAPALFAQAKPAAPKPAIAPASSPVTKAAPAPSPAPAQAQAPATPAKWVKPIKGIASIEVIQGVPKRVGGDIVTVLKVKNTSSGSIGLLKVDEYWYNKKLAVVTGDTQRYPRPFNPGDVIELTMKSPVKPDLFKSQYAFSHAGGTVNAKGVKKFE